MASTTTSAAETSSALAKRLEVDRSLNTAAVVEDVDAIRQSWTERSVALRRQRAAVLDLPYGSAARARLDLFPCGLRNAPTLLFFHGGFWRRNSKDEFSFVAAGPLARGFNVAVVGHTLAPELPIRGIINQAWQSASWLSEKRSSLGLGDGDLYAAGWSAGGHLAATLGTHPNVKASIAVSGLFDLDPIRRSSYNETLGLTDEDVIADSPILTLSATSNPMLLAVGGAELPEFKRQSRAFFEARQARGLIGELIELPGLHHYATLDQFADADSPLIARLHDFARCSRTIHSNQESA